MLEALWNLLFFVIALGLLVVIHEGGHYFAALWCKVKVYRFSIGFGPVLYKCTMKNGTEFAISAIPLGGYVRMKGESDDDGYEDKETSKGARVIESDFAHLVSGAAPVSDSFADKSVGQRALIIAAGPLCNIILAVVLFAFANMSGVLTVKSVVGQVFDNSIAAQAQLKEYDFVYKVGEREVDNWSDVFLTLISHVGQKDVPIEVKGDFGKGPVRHLNLDLSSIEIDPERELHTDLGITLCYGYIPDHINYIVEGSAAQKAGLQEGDKILALNGTPTPKWSSISQYMKSYKGSNQEAIVIEFERQGQVHSVEVIPNKMVYEDGTSDFTLGVGIKIEPMDELYTTTYYGPIDATCKAFADTARMSRLIFDSIKAMISGLVSPKNISGPIAIASGAGQSASFGLSAFLCFMAALSVNFGILNLFPIPVLDGGQLMFLAYEKLSGRAPNEKVQRVLIILGLAMLLSLTMLAIFNDLAAL